MEKYTNKSNYNIIGHASTRKRECSMNKEYIYYKDSTVLALYYRKNNTLYYNLNGYPGAALIKLI